MKYLLDTNVCIDLMRHKGGLALERIKSLHVGDIGISTITLAELQHGVARSRDREQNQAAMLMFSAPLMILDFDRAAAEVYGDLRAQLETAGQSIGAMGTLIAAHALSLDVTLVTNNLREFDRVAGLRVEDWVHGSESRGAASR